MATINANSVAIFIDTAGGSFPATAGANPATTTSATSFKPVMSSTQANVSLSNSTFESTAITNNTTGATTRTFAVGTQSASLQVEGVLDFATDSDKLDLDSVFDAFLLKSEITVVWASTDSTSECYGGQGFLTSFELNSGVDDFGTFTCGIELSGDLQSV